MKWNTKPTTPQTSQKVMAIQLFQAVTESERLAARMWATWQMRSSSAARARRLRSTPVVSSRHTLLQVCVCVRVCVCVCVCVHTHARTHACMHARMHARAQTDRETDSLVCQSVSLCFCLFLSHTHTHTRFFHRHLSYQADLACSTTNLNAALCELESRIPVQGGPYQ